MDRAQGLICLVSRLMFFLFAIQYLWSVADDDSRRYFAFCVERFFVLYAAGHYLDAAVWGRRIAETYCNYIFLQFSPSYLEKWYGLAELAWELPDWVYAHSAYAHLFGQLHEGATVYDDLEVLRRYGNNGAHADRSFRIEHLCAQSEAVCAVLRVSLSFVVWSRVFAQRSKL